MTTSLELSKQLWGKGLKIETEKWWLRYLDGANKEYWEIVNKNSGALMSRAPSFTAPSTDELLAVLPSKLERYTLTIFKYDTKYYVCYPDNEKWFGEDTSLPEALGKLCLYLLSNSYHYNPETKMIEREK